MEKAREGYISLKLLALKRKEAFYLLREKTGQSSLRQLAGSVSKNHTNVHCATASREQTQITWPHLWCQGHTQDMQNF